MSKHYTKLLLLLIPLPVWFFLSLAVGSAEEPCELCHLCQNKALVKAAILAFDEDPYDANLPEQFDPNYVQWDADSTFAEGPTPHHIGPVAFESIISEGDMVAVRLSWNTGPLLGVPGIVTTYTELAIYRIAGGKIVEGWVAEIFQYSDQYD